MRFIALPLSKPSTLDCLPIFLLMKNLFLPVCAQIHHGKQYYLQYALATGYAQKYC